MRRGTRAGLLLLGVVAAALAVPAALPAPASAAEPEPVPGVPVTVTIPQTGGRTVDDAVLRWGLNVEATGGAYFGGCNFLSAGLAGDSGSAHVWTAADGLYRSSDGDVRIERPDGSGAYVPATWDTRCLDVDGAAVSAASVVSTTRQEAVLSGGEGEVDVRAGTATVRWTGSVSSAFYGGMSYWSFTDPVLTVRADGTGALTASVSGYGTDMTDLSRWEPIAARQATLATLSGVQVTDTGIVVTPDYLGVDVVAPSGSAAQVAADATNAGFRGAFPQSFVDFHARTGLASYWYTSGAARDRAKPPLPVLVSFDASTPVARPPSTPTAVASPTASNPLRLAPAGSASSTGVLPGASAAETSTVWPVATSPATVLAGQQGLIPGTAASTGRAVHEPVLWGLSGALAVSSGLLLGLSKGWLVLPWR